MLPGPSGNTERMHDDGDSLNALWARLRASKGDARGLHTVFHRSCTPMILADNERRHVDANAAARLLLRMSLHELRAIRGDDLFPAQRRPLFEELWSTLMREGVVAGEVPLRFTDGPQMTMAYCGAANILPGGHLIVFLPASWPEDELGGFVDQRPPAASGQLTEREREVLTMVARGADVTEIAAQLTLSSHTVRTHLRNAMRRLGARNRAHAIALALRSGEVG